MSGSTDVRDDRNGYLHVPKKYVWSVLGVIVTQFGLIVYDFVKEQAEAGDLLNEVRAHAQTNTERVIQLREEILEIRKQHREDYRLLEGKIDQVRVAKIQPER